VLIRGLVQKPDLLTTFSQSDSINNTNLNINGLTPVRDGQDIPAKGGQGHRFFQPIKFTKKEQFLPTY
jgi:hypothetical protein